MPCSLRNGRSWAVFSEKKSGALRAQFGGLGVVRWVTVGHVDTGEGPRVRSACRVFLRNGGSWAAFREKKTARSVRHFFRTFVTAA